MFKIKRTPNGKIGCYKARFVDKGFNQQYGLDYHETLSLVIKLATIHVVLSLVMKFNWHIK